MSRPVRVLIYARGTDDEILEQQANCYEQIAYLRDHEVVSIAQDPPGGRSGWLSASLMVEAGEVDRILCASRDVIPGLDAIESVTQELRVPHQPPTKADPARHRRTQPIWRRWGAGA